MSFVCQIAALSLTGGFTLKYRSGFCLAAFLLCLCFSNISYGQKVNLTNLQHELRWLDEMSYPPFVTDSLIGNELINYTANAIAHKYKKDIGMVPKKIDYKLISFFGTPRLETPTASKDPEDYQASVMSFITRATKGMEVFWEMRIEIVQNGQTVYSKKYRHQLVNYEGRVRWFNENSFIEHFELLIDELLELRPAFAFKYIIGNGIDHAGIFLTESNSWQVDKNNVLLGFGMPSFGPYKTVLSGKLDSPVLVNKKVSKAEGSIGISSAGFSFDDFKNIDITKEKLCGLTLGSGQDTLVAQYSIISNTRGQRRTFLSQLLTKEDDENSSQQSAITYRNLRGMVRTKNMDWAFEVYSYYPNGIVGGGYLANSSYNFQVTFDQHEGNRREIILKNDNGEYIASLINTSELRLRNSLDEEARDAVAVFYAVILSAKNIQ